MTSYRPIWWLFSLLLSGSSHPATGAKQPKLVLRRKTVRSRSDYFKGQAHFYMINLIFSEKTFTHTCTQTTNWPTAPAVLCLQMKAHLKWKSYSADSSVLALLTGEWKWCACEEPDWLSNADNAHARIVLLCRHLTTNKKDICWQSICLIIIICPDQLVCNWLLIVQPKGNGRLSRVKWQLTQMSRNWC